MMTERTPGSYTPFQKKIVPYLDGSLSAEERAEFEAFVMTHPEFEAHIKTKQDEIALIMSLIPTTVMSKQTEVTLENEMKASIFHLMKEEPKSMWESLSNTLEEWINR
jgi:anti-sigma-K factor RskA